MIESMPCGACEGDGRDEQSGLAIRARAKRTLLILTQSEKHHYTQLAWVDTLRWKVAKSFWLKVELLQGAHIIQIKPWRQAYALCRIKWNKEQNNDKLTKQCVCGTTIKYSAVENSYGYNMQQIGSSPIKKSLMQNNSNPLYFYLSRSAEKLV